MRNILLAVTLAIASVASAHAQKKEHKVVFEITSSDTADHRTVLRQINNVLKDVPNTRVEVVCHGAAIFMLVKDKTVLGEMMQDLKTKNVSFAACNNSMRKNNLTPDQLVPVANVVPNGVMEVVTKEEEGWSYIKAGH
ncbi:MAG: DsrE family protein [Bacteroidota bacterium]|nr:DsrE family protein [Bacteroidota bacterium]